jgi:hypothetical protein
MLKKAVQQGRSERKSEASPFSPAHPKPAETGFFSPARTSRI